MTTPDRSADINAIGAGFASFNGIMASILSMSALGYLNEFVMIFAYHLAVPYGTPALHQKLWDRYGDEKEASPSGSFEIVFLAAFSLSTIISSLIFLSIFPQDWSPMRFGTVDVILAVVALGVMTFGSRTRLPLHKAAKILEDQQLRLKIALGGSAFLYPQLVSLRSSGGFALYLTLCGAMMYLGTSVSTAVIRVVFFVLLARVIFTYISYYRGIPIAQKRIPLAQVIAGFGSMMIGHTDGVLDHVSSILLCIVIFTFLRALSNYLAYTSVYLKDRRFSGVKGRARGGPPGAWDDIFYDSIYIMHSRGLSDNKMSILLFGSFALLSLGYCHNHVTSLVELNILAGGVVFFLYVLAYRTLKYSLRVRRMSGNEHLSSAEGNIVLFLRPFSSDLTAVKPFAAPRIQGSDQGILWKRVLRGAASLLRFWGSSARMFFMKELTLEEFLSNLFQDVGPLVALGRPGELVAPLGAARDYVSEDSWRTRVKEMASRATLAIIELADTESVRWELHKMKEVLGLKNIVILVPSFRHDASEGAIRHANVWKVLQEEFPFLPDYDLKAVAIIFDEHDRPEVVRSEQCDWGDALSNAAERIKLAKKVGY